MRSVPAHSAKLWYAMQTLLTSPSSEQQATALPLWLATEQEFPALLEALPPAARAWARAQAFVAERYRSLAVPGADGSLGGAVLGLGPLRAVNELCLWDAALLPERLPSGTYRLASALGAPAATQFALGWLLGSYRRNRYRGVPARAPARNALIAPPGADLRYARAAAD